MPRMSRPVPRLAAATAAVAAIVLAAFALGACARRAAESPTPAPRVALDAARQLVLVTTAGWDTTSGTLRRFVRDRPGEAWRADGDPVPVVVGRTGLAWGVGASAGQAGEPEKHEGDGRAPAGVFPLDTAFGFAPRGTVPWIRLPYLALEPGTECVDDGASVHYNAVVNRGAVSSVDWTSAERMREIDQYRLGVLVGYNTAPTRGRGSCIFLHIWKGPGSTTAGCTAFDAGALEALLRWLEPARRPTLVQLPDAAYRRLRGPWGLP